jgi:hypothetical protein
MRGAGGTEGGIVLFFIGLGLATLGLYFFFDSVYVTTAQGLFSRMLGGGRGHGGHGITQTTSMGILFVPFLIGVIALFYDASRKWAWWILYLGIAIIAIEVLSHLRFDFRSKLTHLLLMMILFGGGVGLMLRSYRDSSVAVETEDEKK